MAHKPFGKRGQNAARSRHRMVLADYLTIGALASAALIAMVTIVPMILPSQPSDTASTAAAVASLPSHWVTTQRLARHTCPSTRCGVVGEFYYRQGVDILEERNGFARVTKFYDASCVNGRSDYVDSGPAGCTNVNGIENNQFAEWVELSALSVDRPVDPAEGATGTAALVGNSDDFNLYRAQFVQAAEKLMAQGTCTPEQIGEFGGFWASVNLKPRKAYFVSCGSAKYYLDVTTGEIWRG